MRSHWALKYDKKHSEYLYYLLVVIGISAWIVFPESKCPARYLLSQYELARVWFVTAVSVIRGGWGRYTKQRQQHHDDNNNDDLAMFTGVSRWAETVVLSNAVNTRGSILTGMTETVVGQPLAPCRFVFPTYSDHKQTLRMFVFCTVIIVIMVSKSPSCILKFKSLKNTKTEQ